MSGFLDFLLPAAAVAGTALTAGAAAPAAAGALAAGEAASAAIPTALATDAALAGSSAALAPAAATAAEAAPMAAAATAPTVDATTAAMTANQGLTGVGSAQGTAGVPQGFAQMLSPTAPPAQTGALTPGLQVQGLNSVAVPELGTAAPGATPNLAPSIQSMTPPAAVGAKPQSLTPQQLNSINQLMNNDGQKPPPQPGAPAAPQGRALPSVQMVGAPQYATAPRGGLASILSPRR